MIRSCSAGPCATMFFFFSSRRRHTRSKRDWEFRRVLFRSLPQLYEESRRRKARFDATRELLEREDLTCPQLSTRLLDRYFESYIDRKFLPPVERSHRTDRSEERRVGKERRRWGWE